MGRMRMILLAAGACAVAACSHVANLVSDGGADTDAFAWHTFYGSAASDSGHFVTVDGSGNIYVAGYSDSSWNGPGGEPPLHAHAGGRDLLVFKHSL